ncbi:hypothetical protein [Streptomyces sp. NBC_01508]|uniref:hypothetical protein n=1 Tax=Streptomyces sp. NBC_01508 TaxID=2903888 RepID=UPI00386C046E
MARLERNLLPPGAYRTFGISQKPDVLISAACEQVGCEGWRNGWQSAFDESTELGKQQAGYVRHRSGRTFREMRTAAGLTVFRFEPHQRCFADHKTQPQLFAVRDGDYRGNPTGRHRQHARPQDWVEDFGENQLALVDRQRQG